MHLELECYLIPRFSSTNLEYCMFLDHEKHKPHVNFFSTVPSMHPFSIGVSARSPIPT